MTETSVLNLKPTHTRSLIHYVQNLVGVEGLFEKPISTMLYRLECSTFGIAARNYHNLKRVIASASYVDECEAFGNIFNVRRQVKIAHYDINLFGIDESSCILSRRSLQDLIIRSERPVETAAHGVVVVNDKYRPFNLRLLRHSANSTSEKERQGPRFSWRKAPGRYFGEDSG
jgi:hypothetical protein